MSELRVCGSVEGEERSVLAGRKALVADDDAAIRLLLKHVLTRIDFDVELARDGAEAIEKMRETDFAVIVLDLMMPRIDGVAVVHYLARYDPEKLPHVIVMTAFGASTAGKVCPPIERFIEKPFDVNNFLEVVTKCCCDR